MTVRVLAIGDLANNVTTMKKFVKSRIHLVNFPWNTASKIMDEKDDIEFFDSINVINNIKKINKIKNEFDICLALSPAGARVAYLCDLNYIILFVGNDIRTPPFEKNVKDPYASNSPLKYNFNYFERGFYRTVYMNAVACVAGYSENFNFLKKIRKDARRIDLTFVDTEIFNDNTKIKNLENKKFTFFSPQRIALQKGYDIILDALPLCKTDFEIVQVKWFETRNEKEIQFMNNIIKDKPKQIRFIETMSRKKLAEEYSKSDAILGQMKAGHLGAIERESAYYKKPIIAFNDVNTDYIIQGKKVSSPFVPTKNDPQSIAKIMDTIVSSKEFREDLAQNEHNFVKEITDPKKTAEAWDNLFEEFTNSCNTISRNSSRIRIFFRLFSFLFINKLYWKKIVRN